ncbi:MAG: hypothetical protein HOW73_31045 [Polyangiaceae bacterium]|nr:hypothetical protein [Polyangiaceae bacterium]
MASFVQGLTEFGPDEVAARATASKPWLAHRMLTSTRKDCSNGEVVTLGSISRGAAAERFPFLAPRFSGRRRAIKEFTHRDPDFVFWIYPDGTLFDARDAHRNNVPRGYEHILEDEPEYGGFLRGRVASDDDAQLVVVYCVPDALTQAGAKLSQFVRGIEQMPIPIAGDALVISDNGDIFGTVDDLVRRSEG